MRTDTVRMAHSKVYDDLCNAANSRDGADELTLARVLVMALQHDNDAVSLMLQHGSTGINYDLAMLEAVKSNFLHVTQQLVPQTSSVGIGAGLAEAVHLGHNDIELFLAGLCQFNMQHAILYAVKHSYVDVVKTMRHAVVPRDPLWGDAWLLSVRNDPDSDMTKYLESLDIDYRAAGASHFENESTICPADDYIFNMYFAHLQDAYMEYK